MSGEKGDVRRVLAKPETKQQRRTSVKNGATKVMKKKKPPPENGQVTKGTETPSSNGGVISGKIPAKTKAINPGKVKTKARRDSISKKEAAIGGGGGGGGGGNPSSAAAASGSLLETVSAMMGPPSAVGVKKEAKSDNSNTRVAKAKQGVQSQGTAEQPERPQRRLKKGASQRRMVQKKGPPKPQPLPPSESQEPAAPAITKKPKQVRRKSTTTTEPVTPSASKKSKQVRRKSTTSMNTKPNAATAAESVVSSTADSTMNFLQSLENANRDRKEHKKQNTTTNTTSNNIHLEFQSTSIPDRLSLVSLEDDTPKAKKKHLKKKLSAERQRDIQEAMAKRAQRKKEARLRRSQALQEEEYVDDYILPKADETLPQVGWFSILENSNSLVNDDDDYDDHDSDSDEEHGKEQKKKRKGKKQKQLRSTVDYAHPNYKWNTSQQMEQTSAYFLHMIRIKGRHFNIGNLFTDQPLIPRVYHFDQPTLQTILDKKEDRWWIKARLSHYGSDDQVHSVDEPDSDDDDDDEKGMEALSVFFGPNDIDFDPDNDGDESIAFSIGSVESVRFSDDEFDEFEQTFNGKVREKIEVMPGDFTVLRKEEETFDAIQKGKFMSSLCLGCGTAMVSVQDALQVACPNCGAVTPLNGISLTRPFGIATGVQRKKCNHLLPERKSIFLSSVTTETTDDITTEEPTLQATPGATHISTATTSETTDDITTNEPTVLQVVLPGAVHVRNSPVSRKEVVSSSNAMTTRRETTDDMTTNETTLLATPGAVHVRNSPVSRKGVVSSSNAKATRSKATDDMTTNETTLLATPGAVHVGNSPVSRKGVVSSGNGKATKSEATDDMTTDEPTSLSPPGAMHVRNSPVSKKGVVPGSNADDPRKEAPGATRVKKKPAKKAGVSSNSAGGKAKDPPGATQRKPPMTKKAETDSASNANSQAKVPPKTTRVRIPRVSRKPAAVSSSNTADSGNPRREPEGARNKPEKPRTQATGQKAAASLPKKNLKSKAKSKGISADKTVPVSAP